MIIKIDTKSKFVVSWMCSLEELLLKVTFFIGSAKGTVLKEISQQNIPT